MGGGTMKAVERHMQEINRVEKEIVKTKSWKRKNDLKRYRSRLKKELSTYLRFRNAQ